jgi:hypothetical protein
MQYCATLSLGYDSDESKVSSQEILFEKLANNVFQKSIVSGIWQGVYAISSAFGAPIGGLLYGQVNHFGYLPHFGYLNVTFFQIGFLHTATVCCLVALIFATLSFVYGIYLSEMSQNYFDRSASQFNNDDVPSSPQSTTPIPLQWSIQSTEPIQTAHSYGTNWKNDEVSEEFIPASLPNSFSRHSTRSSHSYTPTAFVSFGSSFGTKKALFFEEVNPIP